MDPKHRQFTSSVAPVSAWNWTEIDEITHPTHAERMRTLRTVAELRSALEPARREGRTIGLVPTMGALHEGHLSLTRRARQQCDVVVVSVFVNPAQFNERSDLERYPRHEQDDAALSARAGGDLLFAPSVEEVYPPGFATSVEVLGITDRLEGAVRGSGHFRGVSTVVTKLLCMAMPDLAYFGQKDAQQVAVIRRLVRDLELEPVIRVVPTVRDADGLALSSRNVRLSPHERERALALPRALAAAVGAADPVATARASLNGLEPDYVELLDLDGATVLAAAARVGSVRLIDNVLVKGTLP
jgi:pantoate--beta-alanine ligase